MKPTLHNIQRDFIADFYQSSKNSTFLHHIQYSTHLPSQERFNIYKGSIVGGLTKCLQATYQVCEKLVGENFFHGLAYTYIETYPSISPDLGDYGEQFADFVETFPPAQCLPYLADICRLCWLWHRAYRSQSNMSFDIQAFSQLSETEQENAIFLLSESAFLFSSNYPIDSIWQMCHSGKIEDISLDKGGVHLLIWRDKDIVKVEKMTVHEWLLASQFKVELPLSIIQQNIMPLNIDLTAMLPDFLRRGWLAGWR